MRRFFFAHSQLEVTNLALFADSIRGPAHGGAVFYSCRRAETADPGGGKSNAERRETGEKSVQNAGRISHDHRRKALEVHPIR